ncbi:MAG: aldo/keto reductase [Clostridia bacterium]|nr:aldo/keto reductase [Clostridia bacterium]
MIYRDFQDMKLSNLGLGCMRLPLKSDNYADVDFDEVKRMVAYAMEHGVNYYDTAWGYHNGNSELAVSRALSAYPRESCYLTTKFPGYDLSNMPKVKEIFAKQLEKCRVDYFDFYLFHNVCEMNIEQYLDPQYGIYDHLIAQKRNGRIKHLGFSAHGAYEVMKRFLEAYGKDMEFCQLQLNFLDWIFQDGKGKVELLREYGIPVWVMEPPRGGKIVSLEPVYEKRLNEVRPGASVVDWSFRFVQGIPDVKVILSGMSNMDQLSENIKLFETDEPLTKNEEKALLNVADVMLNKKLLPCTACRYCTEYCPQELDIPYLISLYNEHAFSGGGFIAPMALAAVDKDKQPSACIGCGSCEQVCPQQIKISEAMSDFSKRLGR